MTITELICEILAQHLKVFGGGIPKTKLLKLAYLTEVKYKRRYMKRITEESWVYYLYGPYLWNYDEILHCKDINITHKNNHENKDMVIITLAESYCNESVSPEIRSFINGIVRSYGGMELADLLEYVYFETEPMINAENRRETLSFDTVLPEDYYKVKELKLDPLKEKQIRREFREKAEALRGKRAN